MKSNKPTITRDTYKKIKKMDHKTMSEYLENFYSIAYNKGVNSVTSTITDKIIRGLENTKGIGEKRMSDIIANINKEISREQS